MLAEGSGCSGPPDLKPGPPDLKPDMEEVCEVIDRLELHRRCLDEALADAYWELMLMLGCHLDEGGQEQGGQEQGGQEQGGQERAGREAPRPF
jgi:hypothetical protein